VNLITGLASDGDTLSGIENLVGSKFDDILTGDAGSNVIDGGVGNDTLEGGAGADTLVGGVGVDTALYGNSSVGVTVSLSTGVSSDGDTLSGIENVVGSSFNDVLTGDAGVNVLDGGAGNDILAGGAGADTLIGGAGIDTADYSSSTAGVTVNLTTGVASDGDTLTSVENLVGSAFDDVLTGSAVANVIDGGAGNDILAGGAAADTLVGGTGIDTADYSAATAGVTVNLATGLASDGDTLSGIENLKGSGFNDILTGSASANALDGGAGDDLFYAGTGSDKFIGGYGSDTVDYTFATAGITVNLTAGANSTGDTLSGIENLTGSNFNDVLSGDAGANVLNGGSGNDILLGDAGADLLIGGSGIDVADYSTSSAGVYINLATGVNHGGDAEGDVLVGIENLKGSAFDDVLIGSAETTVLDGGAGNDILDYSLSTAGVSVNLTTDTAFGGFAAGDIISNFENLRGSAAADQLYGNAAVNELFGGDGNDTLFGFAGMDNIYGGAGNDVIAGGADADYIDGGDGNDTADYSSSAASVSVNLFTGANSDGDTLVSIENVTGSKFDDVISGNALGNTLDGGDGTDTVDYSASTAAVAIDLTAHTAQGGFALNDTLINVENLVGSAFNDTLAGNELANVLDGGAGSDTLQGWAGDDTLNGGAGNDRLYGGVGADHLNGGDGIETADYSLSSAAATVSLISNTGTGGDAQGDILSGIENLTGSAFDDTLTGDNAANRLVGGEGADHLNGGGGDDMILTGGGYDTVDGGAGVDTVSYENSWAGVVVNLATGVAQYGEASRDVLVNVENLLGSAYDDTLTGNAGVNRLNGGAGNDTLDGGAGNDILVGGTGADALIGGAGDQDAASYQDALLGVIVNLALGGTGGEAAGDTYNGVEYVYGSAFNDVITGDAAINRLTGGAGNDVLDGAAGNDYILGEAGNDTVIGGAGADVFVFDSSFGNDTISDFWAGAGRTDRVWLTNTDIHSFADVQSHAVDTAGGVVLAVNGGDSITFTGITVAQLNADDFIFG
ncbi:MAG: calcium-binding protein, partial [Aestuariivirga sp.]